MLTKGKYQHFKGSFYNVLHVARDSETEEYFVVYHPFDKPDDIWIRSLAMFNEVIERNGKEVKRFQSIR